MFFYTASLTRAFAGDRSEASWRQFLRRPGACGEDESQAEKALKSSLRGRSKACMICVLDPARRRISAELIEKKERKKTSRYLNNSGKDIVCATRLLLRHCLLTRVLLYRIDH